MKKITGIIISIFIGFIAYCLFILFALKEALFSVDIDSQRYSSFFTRFHYSFPIMSFIIGTLICSYVIFMLIGNFFEFDDEN